MNRDSKEKLGKNDENVSFNTTISSENNVIIKKT